MLDTGGIIDDSQYCMVVGKMLYLVQKLMIENANAVSEMPKYLKTPGRAQWDVVEYFAGYLKGQKRQIKLTIQKPKEIRSVAMVDSNYTTDRASRQSVL